MTKTVSTSKKPRKQHSPEFRSEALKLAERIGVTAAARELSLYESPRLKGKLHVISKRYTQRIERHNLNLRQHLARLGRKSLSFSKSVELHDKVIGHYLNIKHYQ
nr:IS1 family transposase [Escherichia coli]